MVRDGIDLNETTALKRGWLLLGTGAGILGMLLTAGCSSEPVKPAGQATTSAAVPAAAPSSITPTPDRAATAKTDALAAYKAYTDYKTAALTSGKGDVNRQAAVASGSAYQLLASDIFGAQKSGIVYKGALASHPEVTAVDVTGSPAKATLTDCLDTSGWTAVFAASGNNAAAPGQQTRTFVNIVAEQVPDGTWRVSTYTPDRGRTC
ncbi:hypothetical protein ACFZDG_35720 [Kitasatospora xanthocidica]|uniref:hypothetical protein n=1 Tax=Kitasatospora xanthocidica TaxID=83382 RepID=UPI0036E9EEBF